MTEQRYSLRPRGTNLALPRPETSHDPETSSDTPVSDPRFKTPPPLGPRVASLDPHTPYTHGDTSMMSDLVPHDNITIHPYVQQDLKQAHAIELWPWFEMVFGLSPATLNQWADKIARNDWIHDSIVQKSLEEFCSVNKEIYRYTPFTTLANRIISLAPGCLPGIPKKNPYPVEDLRFAVHYNRMVEPIPEHGVIAGDRRPDIVLVRKEHATRLARNWEDEKANERVRWSDIVCYWELKYGKNLECMFSEATSKNVTISGNSKKTKGQRTRADVAGPEPIGACRKRRVDDYEPHNPLVDQVKYRRVAEHAMPNTLQAALQVGAYGLELLSCSYGTRVSCTAAVLDDDKLSCWYYSPSGIVYTCQTLSLVRDFELAAAIIVAFGSRTPEQYGALPTTLLKLPSAVAFPHGFPLTDLSGCTLHIHHPVTKEKVQVTLKKAVFTQYTLTGRHTFVYQAVTDVKVGPGKLIIKFSYQIATRRAENELIAYARDAGVENVPEIHMWEDLWTLEDVARRADCRSKTQRDKKKVPYEDRIFRAVVYTEYYPLRILFAKHCDAIPIMVNQMLDCLQELWAKARILHRDLSVNNVMWEIRGGLLIFRLIDWDMATIVPLGEKGEVYVPSASHRTGTLPFMAWELVLDAWKSMDPPANWKPIAHLLRHDFASLYFISLWCAELLPTDGVEKVDLLRLIERAKGLEKGGLESIALYKKTVCQQDLEESNIRLPRAAECLTLWFSAWQYLFARSICASTLHQASLKVGPDPGDTDAPSPPPYDWETGGGMLTRDKIKTALARFVPPQRCTVDKLLELCATADADHGPNYLLPEQAPKPRRKAILRRTVQTSAVGRPSVQKRPAKKVSQKRQTATKQSAEKLPAQGQAEEQSKKQPVKRLRVVRQPQNAPTLDGGIRSRLRPRKGRSTS